MLALRALAGHSPHNPLHERSSLFEEKRNQNAAGHLILMSGHINLLDAMPFKALFTTVDAATNDQSS